MHDENENDWIPKNHSKLRKCKLQYHRYIIQRHQIKWAQRVSGITFNKERSKPNNLKVFGSEKLKESKQDSQNRLR